MRKPFTRCLPTRCRCSHESGSRPDRHHPRTGPRGVRPATTADGSRCHDPLYASALAIEAGGEFLLLVACDLLLVDDLLLGDIRRRVSEATGLAPERVWISATHTHTGPSILGVLGTNTDTEYRERFPELAARAAITAWEKREEAVLGMAAGPAPGWTFPAATGCATAPCACTR